VLSLLSQMLAKEIYLVDSWRWLSSLVWDK